MEFSVLRLSAENVRGSRVSSPPTNAGASLGFEDRNGVKAIQVLWPRA